MFFHIMTALAAKVHLLLLKTFGTAVRVLCFVGVQHKVAPGGIECAISGMSIAVVKKTVRSMPTSSPLISKKSPVAVASYPGESFTACYNIIAEPGTLRYFERFKTCASVESLPTYLCHIIQNKHLQ